MYLDSILSIAVFEIAVFIPKIQRYAQAYENIFFKTKKPFF